MSAFVCVGFASMQCHGSNRQTEPNWVRKGILCVRMCVCADLCMCVWQLILPPHSPLRFFILLLCCIIHVCTFHSTTQGRFPLCLYYGVNLDNKTCHNNIYKILSCFCSAFKANKAFRAEVRLHIG